MWGIKIKKNGATRSYFSTTVELINVTFQRPGLKIWFYVSEIWKEYCWVIFDKKKHPQPALVILKEQQVFCHFVFHCKVLLLMVQVLCQRHNGAIHHWLCNASTEHKPTLRKVWMVLQNLRCQMRMPSLMEKATYEKPESCNLFFTTAASHGGCCIWHSSCQVLKKKSCFHCRHDFVIWTVHNWNGRVEK